MHSFRVHEQENAGLVGWGVRVLLLTADAGGPLAARIAGLGGRVDVETDIDAALARLAGDPGGWSLFVADCDHFGGLLAVRGSMASLGDDNDRLSVILVSSHCDRQVFPEDRRVPILLRSPTSAVSLRVGFEHACRDRIGWRAA